MGLSFPSFMCSIFYSVIRICSIRPNSWLIKYRSGTSMFIMNHSLRSLFASQIIFRFAPSLIRLFCGSLLPPLSSIYRASLAKRVVKKNFQIFVTLATRGFKLVLYESINHLRTSG